MQSPINLILLHFMIRFMNLLQLGFFPGSDFLFDLHCDRGIQLCIVLHLLLPFSSIRLLQPGRGGLDQGQVSLNLLNVLRLLDLLGRPHPLEDVVRLPLVLDFFYFLDKERFNSLMTYISCQ